ncbi:MAG: Lrp/AsnC family transcriptional regulator [Candidatus Methanofastidiosia archaeon]
MDKLDIGILKELQENSRIAFRDLGGKFGVSAQTISDRVSKLKDRGIIEKFTLKLNFEKMGYPINFLVELDVELKRMREIQEGLFELSELHLIYVVTGIHDIIALGIARDIEHLHEIIEEKISKIPGVKATTTSISLKTVKETEKKVK